VRFPRLESLCAGPTHLTLPSRVAVLCALAWGAAAHGLTWSADLPAAGDGRHLWLVAPAAALPGEAPGPAVELLHADGDDDGPAWEPVTRLRGRLAALAAPAAGPGGPGTTDRLWLVFDSGAVVRVSLTPGPLEDQWFFSTRPVTDLPAGLDVTAAAAAGDALWVLGRTADAEVLAGFDDPGAAPGAAAAADAMESDAELLNLVLRLPRPLRPEDPSVAPATADPAESIESPGPPVTAGHAPAGPTLRAAGPAATPTELLLVYRGGRWRRVALPPPGPAQEVAALVPPAAGAADARPTRVARVRADGGGVLVTTSPAADGGWERVVLEADAGGAVQGLRVDGQLVVVRQVALSPGTVEAAVVRGAALASLGQMNVEPPDPGDETAAAWAAVPLAGGVGVVSGAARAAAGVANRLAERTTDDPHALTLGVIDLRGRVTRPPAPLDLEPARPFADAADYLLMLTAVFGATLLLFSFWRRDPSANQPRLPEGRAVADLWRRAAGGFIDLAISGAVVSGAMGLTAEDLAQRWPGRGRGDTLEFILPGLLLIGLTVLHTTVTELLTTRSAGKAVMHTRLTDLTGERPSSTQILVRGLLKPFDLIAYLLMVLPVVNPGRQRLADLIARTLVVKESSKSEV